MVNVMCSSKISLKYTLFSTISFGIVLVGIIAYCKSNSPNRELTAERKGRISSSTKT